jgi:hypothetical protein
MPTDKATLLSLMRDVRMLAVRCRGGERHGTPLHAKAEAFQRALDDLAGELTGDREYFWAKPHGGSWLKPAD